MDGKRVARRPAVGRLLITGVAIAVVLIASGCARFATGQSPIDQRSADPSSAGTNVPLPAPDGTTILAVLDPEVVKPKVSAEEAVAVARANMGDMVGESPSVQLVQMTGIEPNDGFTGWIILSTDIVVYPHQPHDPNASVQPTISTIATYTWVLVTPEGEVLMALQNGLDAPHLAGEPLPAPRGDSVVAVLDPAVEAPAIGMEEAIALARTNSPSQVGKSPRAQLVRMAGSDPHSYSRDFTGWLILSTDVRGWSSGVYLPDASPQPSPTVYATYTWVWVTLDGQVLGSVQIQYESPERVPSLP